MKNWRLLPHIYPAIVFPLLWESALSLSLQMSCSLPFLPPPSFSNAHDSPMAVQAAREPRTVCPMLPPLGGREWGTAAGMAGRGGQPLSLTAAPKTLTDGGVCPKADNALKKLSMMRLY